MWGQLSTTCSILKQPNGELLVAVNHSQLRTMASERVDPIDWSHPPPSWAVPSERLVHSINQCTQLDSNVNCSMWGNHLAYAATQSTKFSISLCWLIRVGYSPCIGALQMSLPLPMVCPLMIRIITSYITFCQRCMMRRYFLTNWQVFVHDCLFFPAAQFAYRKGLGRTDALQTISRQLQKALDSGH